MFSKLAFTAALAALLTSTSGHMLITSPFPYGGGSLNNSPLDASGSDYPCKQGPSVYQPPTDKNNKPVQNTAPAGAPQTLSFKGSAVHGGGSCQLSLTTDKAPTKDSKFKVIHSIIGGCPSNKTSGNLPENPNGDSADTFTYSIPDDVPSGDYTFAWTWFNKVGNREMYMNCAPMTVTGGKGTPDTFNKLPDMFIANVGAGTGKVPDNVNVKFDNPGKSVETHSQEALGPATCPPETKGCTTPPSGGAATAQGGGSSGGAPAAGGSSGSSGAAPAPAAPAPAPAASAAGPVGPAGAGSSSAQAPASSPAASPATPGIAPPAGSVPCDKPGALVCIGITQFGICDTNNMAVPQPLAQGTKCSNGAIGKVRRSLHGSSLQARELHAHGSAHAH